MKKGVFRKTMLALVILCLFLTGCASFQKNRLPDTGQLPPLNDKAQALTASYQFTSGLHLNIGSRHDLPLKAQQILEKEFVDTLKESGYFTDLTPENGYINIKVDILNYGSGIAASISGAISGATLLTIPGWATDNYKVTAQVTMADGKNKDYVLDDAMVTVFWLPMIVATPFKGPSKVSTNVRKNIYRTLILKMQQDGLLPPTQAGAATSEHKVTFFCFLGT